MEKDSGYHQRSIAETAMYRFKQLIGPKLSLRSYNAQVGEILAGVKVMNKVIGLGMPIRQAAICCMERAICLSRCRLPRAPQREELAEVDGTG